MSEGIDDEALDEPDERATVAEPVAAAHRVANPPTAAGSIPATATPVPAATTTLAISATVTPASATTTPASGTSTAASFDTRTPSLARSQATTIGSPLQALERDEMLRTRWFCLIALAMMLGGAMSLVFVPGDPTAATMLLVAVVIASIGIAFLYRRTSDPIEFKQPSTMVGFFLPTLAVALAIPYFGVFSPAPALVVLAVYFTGLGSSVRLAVAVWTVCAVSQALTAGLVIGGGVDDPGLVSGAALPTKIQIVIQLLVQLVMVGTFVTARFSRRSALLAVGELERAIRVATQREALLLEAREELDRALRAGRGRFSEQVIAGYELGDVIGRGAMGEVYAATSADGSQAAIKLLSAASLGNPQHVQRFFRELQAASEVRSPNVVRVLGVGDRPVPYLVMERLEGKSLAEIVRGRSKLSADRVVDLVRQVADGLAAASAVGIVHRDIKPQNLFLHHGTWKILDFGVARLAEHGETLTAGQIVGTPSYMSPEQARGTTVDHRTDLYALAAVAYRTITGQPPFAAREVADTLYRVVHTAPRRPSELATIKHDLELVLAIGLAKSADDRFGSARELADAFAQAAAGTLDDAIRARANRLVAAGAWGTAT